MKKAEINEFSKLKNMKVKNGDGNVWAVMLTAHGRQGVPLGVLEVYADACERPHKGVCGKLPV